jgi:peptidoglycan/LPS O-acetylase OafA/YrhL
VNGHSPVIDTLKILAAQAIFWHHFSAYGPMSELFEIIWPTIARIVHDDGRIAVHVFLVIAGYLASAGIERRPDTHPIISVARRYQRLMPVYLVVLVLTCIAVAMTRPILGSDWLPDPPTLPQVLAHILLLQDILAIPALSTGVWYLAIDLQLFSMLAVMTWFIRKWRTETEERDTGILVLLTTAAAMLMFNRNEALDITALYYFGSYGLGILCQRASRSQRDRMLFMMALVTGLIALAIDMRSRLAVAILTSLVLAWPAQLRPSAHSRSAAMASAHPAKRLLAESSYAFFLCHFAWLVIGNAAWQLWWASQPDSPRLASLIALALTVWCLSMVSAVALHRWIETAGALRFLRIR